MPFKLVTRTLNVGDIYLETVDGVAYLWEVVQALDDRNLLARLGDSTWVIIGVYVKRQVITYVPS